MLLQSLLGRPAAAARVAAPLQSFHAGMATLANAEKSRARRSNFVSVLRSRGMVQDVTSPELERRAAQEQLTVYCGIDPTARTLHVGNLLAVMGLVHSFSVGHNVIALVGGATGRIGDPSGRSTERVAMGADAVSANVEGITEVLHRIFRNATVLLKEQQQQQQHHHHQEQGEGAKNVLESDRADSAPLPCEPGAFTVVNNADWFEGQNVIDFFAEVGRFFRVGAMMSSSYVKDRLSSDEGISFLEFSYPVFQGFDFLHLFRSHGCNVQLGGSDQWVNITAGVNLVHKLEGKDTFGITMPLLTTSTGEKFGKSAGNAIWLDATMTSPYDLFQFFINVPDTEVEQYLLSLTLLTTARVEKAMRAHNDEPESKVAQRLLAQQVVTLVHGKEAARGAELASTVLFGKDKDALLSLQLDELDAMFSGVPVVELHLSDYCDKTLVEAGVAAGLFPSLGQGRKLVKQGGFTVNNRRVSRQDEILGCHATEAAKPGNSGSDSNAESMSGRENFLRGQYTVLRRGRKHYKVIKWLP